MSVVGLTGESGMSGMHPATAAVELPVAPIERYDSIDSTIETVGPSTVNLLPRSEALHIVAQEQGVTVTPRATTDNFGRTTATLIDGTAISGQTFVKLADVTRVANTNQVVSVYAKRGPGHNGTGVMRVRVWTGAAFFDTGNVVPNESYTRHEVAIPDTDAGTIAQIYFWPAWFEASPQSVYFANAQLENGTSASTYESTGDDVTEKQITRLVDTVSGRELLPWENSTFSPPLLKTVNGHPSIGSPAGKEAWISRIKSGDTDWPHGGSGFSFAYVWRGGKQYGSSGRGSSLSNPWQVVLRDNTATTANVQVTDTVGIKSVGSTGIGSGWHATVVSVAQNDVVTISTDNQPASTVAIGTLTNNNYTGTHITKLEGGATDTAEHDLREKIWFDTVLDSGQFTQTFSYFKARRWGGDMPW